MIFRNKNIKPEKIGLLICDDLFNPGVEPIAKETLENMPIQQRGSAISGTFGTFSIKEFEKISGGLKDV